MKRAVLLFAAFVLAVGLAPAGETIRVLCYNGPITDAVKSLLPAFEKETGIVAVIESYGEDQHNQKLTVEFTSNQGANLDVFMTRPLQEGRMMRKNGWYEDLTPYFKGDAEYDFADFMPGAVQCTFIDGIQTAIPLLTETQVMYYRKDLLAAKGLKPPTTFEELEKTAALLTDKANDMSGFVARGQRAALITQFSSYLYSFGGDWFDQKTRQSLVNTPEFLAAAQFYGGLLNKYGPPGSLNMSWPQAAAIFGQGKAAMYTDASTVYPVLFDPSKSAFAAQTGVAPMPAGPKARKVFTVNSWAFAMSSKSANKEACWKFIRFMTNKQSTTVMQGQFANCCSRMSVYKDPAGIKAFPADLVTALNESAPYGVGYDRPLVTAVSEARDMIGDIVVTCIEGGDPAPVAKRSSAKFQELINREK